MKNMKEMKQTAMKKMKNIGVGDVLTYMDIALLQIDANSKRFTQDVEDRAYYLKYVNNKNYFIQNFMNNYKQINELKV